MKTAMIASSFGALAALLTLSGCAASTRTPAQYQEDTAKAFSEKESELRTCYENAQKAKPDAQGTVVVDFWWRTSASEDARTPKNTGNHAPKVLASSTAPEDLQNCVLDVVKSATLRPAGKGVGHPVWTFTFAPGSAPAAEPAPAS